MNEKIMPVMVYVCGLAFIAMLFLGLKFIEKQYAVIPAPGQEWMGYDTKTEEVMSVNIDGTENGKAVGKALINGKVIEKVYFTYESTSNTYTLEDGENVIYSGKFKGIANERVIVGGKEFLVTSGGTP
ncbi:MAG TPA: hypothetical protein DCG28_05645 [Lachnospiraceae bacterium]|nr:hypothetical protein [Lachnospiraceae bacterium]